MRASIIQVSLILVALVSVPACGDGSGGSGGAGASGGQGGGGGQGGQGGAGGAGGQGGTGQGGMGGTGGAGGGGLACGGIIGGGCGTTEFCDAEDQVACYPDAPGICKPRPDVCPADCPGVCGCNGKTYCNMCVANTAGFDAVPGGPCK